MIALMTISPEVSHNDSNGKRQVVVPVELPPIRRRTTSNSIFTYPRCTRHRPCTSERGDCKEYVLTEMGHRLFPVATALRQWAADYLFDESRQGRAWLVGAPESCRWWKCTPPMENHGVESTQVVICEERDE